MLKHTFIILFAAILGKTAYAQTLETVNVCYQDLREEMVTAALQFGESKKIFENAGLKVNWIKNANVDPKSQSKVFEKSNFNPDSEKYYFNGVTSEVDLLQRFKEKECDFISTTFEALVASGDALNQVDPVAVFRYGKDYDTHLVVRKDSSIKDMKDLKGKKVRINQIGSLIPFLKMLKDAGISSKDVVITKVSLANLPKALDSGEVDVVLSYNPTIPLLLGSGRVRILEKNMFSRFYPHHIPHSMLVVDKGFMAKKKSAYDKFVQAFSKASTEMVSKPDNIVYAVPYVSKNYSGAQIEKSLSYLQVEKPLIVSEMDRKQFFQDCRFEDYLTALHSNGFLKNKVSLASWNK